MVSSLELARLCGVSQGTVDRALHNRPGISQSTRNRILAAAAMHGYLANPAARELLHGERLTVGAIIPSLNNLFFLDLFQRLKEHLSQRGMRLLLTPVSDAVDFLNVLGDFAARRFAAALVVPPIEGITIPRPVSLNMPVIAYASPCLGLNVSFLGPDEMRTGVIAVEYLRSLGHCQIAHVTYARQASGIEHREAGYTQAMRAAGLHPLIVRNSDDTTLASLICDRGITAMWCHNDWLALQVWRAMERANVAVPEAVSILGVDDSPTFAAICPNLSTMGYPIEAIAIQTVRRLFSEPVQKIPDLQVVPRGTCTQLR